MQLFHWTCNHMAEQIDACGGILEPHRQPLLNGAIITWLTDDRNASRLSLGLSSTTLTCDRMEALYEVGELGSYDAEPWVFWRSRYTFDPKTIRELHRGARPLKWWVAQVPLKAIRVQ